jgi:hypothetical protein
MNLRAKFAYAKQHTYATIQTRYKEKENLPLPIFLKVLVGDFVVMFYHFGFANVELVTNSCAGGFFFR